MIRRGVSLGLVYAVALMIFLATYTHRPHTDTELNRLQARAFVHHLDIDLSRYSLPTGFVERHRGDTYSVYGIGVTLVALPLVAPAIWLGAPAAQIEGLASIPFVAGAVVAMFALLLGLVPRRVAVGATVVFGFGTTLWPIGATAYWQHAPVALFTVLGCLALFHRERGAPLPAGLWFGLAVLVRPSTVVALVAVGLWFAVTGRVRGALRYAGGAALPLLTLVVQNRWIWGSWTQGGYSRAGIPFNGDVLTGLRGELFSWWRGLFVYSPVLVLAVVGVAVVIRRKSPVASRAVVLVAASVGSILLYARWYTWWGGQGQFGYRYLLDIVPFLVVLAALAVAHRPRLAAVAVPLASLSVLTMAAGVQPEASAWDLHDFAPTLAASPIGRAWSYAADHPGGLLMRAVLIGGFAALLAKSRQRVDATNPPESVDIAPGQTGR